jgi:uncharacterized protein
MTGTKFVSFTELEIKEAAGKSTGGFSGYAATYRRDSVGDKILPGAFAASIQARGGKIPILMNHDSHVMVGGTNSLAEDGRGLALDATLFDTTQGRDAWALLKGAQGMEFPMGLSIGYNVKDSEWDVNTQTRILKEIDLWEASITPFPANRMARVDAVKSIRNFERLLRDVTKCSAEQAKRMIAYLPPSAFTDVDAQSLPPARDVRDQEQFSELMLGMRTMLERVNS